MPRPINQFSGAGGKPIVGVPEASKCLLCGAGGTVTHLGFMLAEGSVNLCDGCFREFTEYLRAKINFRARVESCIRREAKKWQAKC